MCKYQDRFDKEKKEDKAMSEKDDAGMNSVVKRSGELFESGLY